DETASEVASGRWGLWGRRAKTECPVKARTASSAGRHGGTRREPPSGSGNRPAAAAAISRATGWSAGTPPTVQIPACARPERLVPPLLGVIPGATGGPGAAAAGAGAWRAEPRCPAGARRAWLAAPPPPAVPPAPT